MNTNDKLRELIRSPLSTADGVAQADRNAVLEEAARAMESLAFFTDVDELLTMTKQEMSVRTCHEGAAAIRALRSTEAPAQEGE